MKKRFLSLITIILAMVMCVFGLVGCGKDDLKGFDIDLAKAVGEELGIDIQFELIVWDSKEVEINAGTIDLIWNGMTIKPEMYNHLEISKPYLTNNQVMVVKADSTLTKSQIIADSNCDVVAENGSAGETEATIAFPNKTIHVAQDQVTCLTEILSGNRDVAVLDSTLAGWYISNDESSFKGKLKVVTNSQGQYDTLSSEEYGIAAKKGNKALIAKINDTLAKLYANGTMKEIAEEYGFEELLIDSSWTNYTNTFDALSETEKAAWNDIVEEGCIKIGYTIFAPVAYK